MFVKWKLVIVVCSVLFSSALVSAADVPVPEAAISSDASIVIRLQKPKESLQKISSLVNQVDESLTAVVAGNLRTLLGRSIANPALTGIDNTRDLFVGVFLSQTKRPGLLYIVPVKDEKSLKAALDKKYQNTTYEKWILYSEDQKLVDQAMELLKSRKQNFRSQMSPRALALFSKGDLSIFVNSQKLVQIYQPQLEQAGQKVDVALKQISETANTAPGVNMKPILAMYSTLAKGALQAVKDSQSYTTAFRVDSQGMGLESLFEVKEKSKTDELFQSNPPQNFAQLGKFPANQLLYFAGAGNTDALITWGMNFTAQMFDESKPASDAKSKFKNLVKEIHRLKFGSYYFSIELGKLSKGVLNAYTVSEVEPSEKMRKYSHEMMSLMQGISLPGIKQQITFTPDAEKIGSETVDLTVIKQEVDPEFDPLQIQKQILDVLYGPSGITNRMAYPKGKVLQVMGAHASMKKFLDALNAPTDSNLIAQNQAIFKQARQQGLKQANILLMVDVPSCVAKGFNLFAESRQKKAPFSEGLIKKQGISPSYLTFSLSMEKQSMTTKTYVPVQNLKSGFKIFSIISTQK